MTKRRLASDDDGDPSVLQLLVDSVVDYAIFTLDPSGCVATWNAGAERIKGYRAEEIIGRHFSIFYPEDDIRAGKCERELAGAATSGRFEDEGWRVRKDGTRFWANVVITPLRKPGGELLGFAKVTRDLTERRAAEDERIRRAKAEEAVRLRDEFLSIASHELRTPLTALTLQVQSLVASGACERNGATKLQRIERTSARLQALIDVLLDVSRIATGKFTIRRSQNDLVAIAHEVIDRLAERASEAGCAVTLEKRVERALGEWDALRIEQALANVLENAFKYAAGRPVHVVVDANDDSATVVVEDEGPGVLEADRDRIFERFERASPRLNFGGFGLGLYVTREIVAAHGGEISVGGRDGKGARFALRLPLVSPTG